MDSAKAPLAIGIDLGTTYSCIAYIDEYGKPLILKNFEGDSITPSVISFQDGSDEVIVGKVAKSIKAQEPLNVVEFIKRSMGRKNMERFIGDKSYQPEELSSFILSKLVKDAAEKLGRPVEQAVITCPAYFGTNEREATAQAGVISGLKGYTEDGKPNIIPEPTAASFFYGLQKSSSDELVMVYDLGGGTFDVTLLEVKNGSVKSICIGGNHELGGKDWDDDIANDCIQQVTEQGADPERIKNDPVALGDMSLKIEEAKKLLTAKEKTMLVLYFDGAQYRIELTREKFDRLTRGRLESTITLTNEMLESAKEKGFSSFSRILLVGGSTRMPQVRKRLETEFPGIPIEFNDPDEAVAKGAALFAQKLMIDGKIKEELFKLMGDDAKGKTIEEVERENPEAFKQANETTSIDFGLPPSVVEKLAKITVKNCTSKSFGVIVLDRTTNKEIIANLILKNKSLPATVSQKFGTIENNQPSVQLQIVESLITDKEISDLSLATKIGDSTLPLPPGLPENSPIEITFSFDDAGLLQYSGRDLSSDNHIEGEIKTDAVMSEEDVAQAIERMKKITVI